MHRPPELIVAVLAELEQGASVVEVARARGIPEHTVRNWRRRPPAAARRLAAGHPVCRACHGEHEPASLDGAAYAYLLGVYLGDGCIGATRARTC